MYEFSDPYHVSSSLTIRRQNRHHNQVPLTFRLCAFIQLTNRFDNDDEDDGDHDQDHNEQTRNASVHTFRHTRKSRRKTIKGRTRSEQPKWYADEQRYLEKLYGENKNTQLRILFLLRHFGRSSVCVCACAWTVEQSSLYRTANEASQLYICYMTLAWIMERSDGWLWRRTRADCRQTSVHRRVRCFIIRSIDVCSMHMQCTPWILDRLVCRVLIATIARESASFDCSPRFQSAIAAFYWDTDSQS